MMENQNVFKYYSDKKNQNEITLSKIKNIVFKGRELGVEIPSGIEDKIENVIQKVDNNTRIKVALIGGFSEGKTSIAAAWMGKLDKSTMKISQQESSDEVNVYVIDDEIELIDTPGLFGLKEKFNMNSGMMEKYKDITKKYVSEAHLVLYVMNPTNPIKESHKDDLIWLFRTLNLLPRTVFVLSRFDEVADIEDEWEYENTLKIKRDNVTGRLKQFINLSEDEIKSLEIVGIAANPYGNGIDYWLNNIEEFEVISKVKFLQKATYSALKRNGGYFSILDKMQSSVIVDILNNLEGVENISLDMKQSIQVFREENEELLGEIQSLKDKISITSSKLFHFLDTFFADMKRQIRGCSLETIQVFLETEIGAEGNIIYSRIQNEFNRQTRVVENNIERIQISFNASLNQLDSTLSLMEQGGVNLEGAKAFINRDNILIARDGIVNFAKMLGTDLSQYLKFNPYGAINLAKNLSTGITVLSGAMQAWQLYQRYEKEQQFKKEVNDMVKTFDLIYAQLTELVQSDNFSEKFFPQFVELQKSFRERSEEVALYESRLKEISQWCDEVKVLAKEV